jgi:cholesterol transport system auxiliary component
MAAASSTSRACEVELGTIAADSDLGENIVYRFSAHEVGHYESRRWSEAPDAYLRRALVRRLFDEGRCRRVVSGAATTLEARLIAFEEQRGPPHRARVVVHMILSDEQVALHEETIDLVRDCGAGDGERAFEEFVRAISQALDDVVVRIAEISAGAAVRPGQ